MKIKNKKLFRQKIKVEFKQIFSIRQEFYN